jgi:Uma2 family endonuclease
MEMNPTILSPVSVHARPDPGHPEELVRGRIVAGPCPDRHHGQVCTEVIVVIGRYLERHDLGHLLCNGSGLITTRNPDTVRGADVAFYSYGRLPKGALPPSYGPEVPELVVEVLSPGDRWADVLAKVGEYLAVGVSTVLVLDDLQRSAELFRPDTAPRSLAADDEVSLPDILPGFAATVGVLLG